MLVAYAIIDDATGVIESHGHCGSDDLSVQEVSEGKSIVLRPEHVTSFRPWRYCAGEWIEEESP